MYKDKIDPYKEILDPLNPQTSLLIKLGSAVRHAEEMLDPVKGHHFDLMTFKQLFQDSELQSWFKAMDEMGLLPVKR